MRHLMFSLLLLMPLLIWGTPVQAEDSDGKAKSYGIAAVVNEDIITSNDIQERMQLVIALSGMKDSPEVRQHLVPQLMRTLIDESLQKQAAASASIIISRDELNSAIASIEKENSGHAGGMNAFLAHNHISRGAMERQIEAQIVWSKLMNSRIQPKVRVTENEVNEALETIGGTQNVTEIKLAELILPVAEPSAEADAQELSNKLVKEIKDGADFSKLAKQFSGTGEPDAVWQRVEQLPNEVKKAVQFAKQGEVTDPVRMIDGYHIVKLIDRRQAVKSSPDESEVLLRQIVFPLAANSSKENVDAAITKARDTAARISGCKDFEAVARGMTMPVKWDLGRVQLKSLHPGVKKIVGTLKAGEISKPFRTELGVHLMTVCERIEAGNTLVNVSQVREALAQKKMALEARRFMRDLRRDAFIEIRL